MRSGSANVPAGLLLNDLRRSYTTCTLNRKKSITLMFQLGLKENNWADLEGLIAKTATPQNQAWMQYMRKTRV